MKSLVKKLFSLCIFLIIFSVYTQAQAPILPLPLCYQKPHYKQTCDTSANTTFNWIVYSDRSNNVALLRKEGKPNGKFIDFMDRFFVTERKGNYLHIFKDDIRANREKALTPSAEDFGWITLDRVLPSRFCFLNEQNVYMKAILLNTINTAIGDISQKDFKTVIFYKDPALKELSKYTCNIYNYFYVYKVYPEFPKAGTAVLLGTKPRFEPSDTSSIKGWVDINYITFWDHRVTLLPNTDIDAVKERKSKNFRAVLFPITDKEDAIKFQNGISYSEQMTIWTADSCWTADKYTAYIPRFPIMYNNANIEDANGIMKIGVIGEVTTASKATINKIEFAEAQRQFNERRRNARYVNILFIIDGTQSMQPYLKGVSDAITNSMSQLQDNTNNKFKFAVTIYRDKSEGDSVITNYPLTDNYREIAKWLPKQRAFSSPNDRDFEEAVYYGLKEGLRRTSLPLDQTNYVILVGDAGDHGTRPDDFTNVSQKEVIDLLYRYNSYFIAFQVNNPMTAAYVKFVEQTKQILNLLAQNYYRKNLDFAKKAGWEITAAPVFLPQTSDRKHYLSNSPFNGFIMQSFNSTIPPAKLTAEIVKTLSCINDSTNLVIEEAQKLIENGNLGQDGNKVKSGTLTYLSSMNIAPDNIKHLAEKHAQLYYEGLSAMNTKQLSYPVWKFELLYTQKDLGELINSMDRMQYVDDDTELRENFDKVWRELLKGHLGKSPSSDELEDKSLGDIEKLVFGCVGTTPILTMKLGDLKNKDKISIKELHGWAMEIDKKQKILARIFNQTTPDVAKYTFDSNEERYYWIPQSLLP